MVTGDEPTKVWLCSAPLTMCICRSYIIPYFHPGRSQFGRSRSRLNGDISQHFPCKSRSSFVPPSDWIEERAKKEEEEAILLCRPSTPREALFVFSSSFFSSFFFIFFLPTSFSHRHILTGLFLDTASRKITVFYNVLFIDHGHQKSSIFNHQT